MKQTFWDTSYNRRTKPPHALPHYPISQPPYDQNNQPISQDYNISSRLLSSNFYLNFYRFTIYVKQNCKKIHELFCFCWVIFVPNQLLLKISNFCIKNSTYYNIYNILDYILKNNAKAEQKRRRITTNCYMKLRSNSSPFKSVHNKR